MWVHSHIAQLQLPSAQLAGQQKLHLFQILLSHVLMYFVQHHPEGEGIRVKTRKTGGGICCNIHENIATYSHERVRMETYEKLCTDRITNIQ